MDSRPEGLAGGWLWGAREALLEALGRAHPGLELVDAQLELETGAGHVAIDWLGFDASGRIVAVLWLGVAGVTELARVLDAFAALVRDRAGIVEHLSAHRLSPRESGAREAGDARELGRGRLDAPREPLVLALAERFDEAARARVGALRGDVVRAFEVRQLKSQRGRTTTLQLLGAGALPEAPVRGLRALLEGVAPERVALAEGLARRVALMDEELELHEGEEGLAWAFRGQPVCSLQARRGGIEGRIGDEAELFDVRSSSDGDAFLEESVRRFQGLLVGSPATLSGAAGGPGGSAGFDEDRDLRPHDPSAPILTPEEIAAFQQPMF